MRTQEYTPKPTTAITFLKGPHYRPEDPPPSRPDVVHHLQAETSAVQQV